VHFPEMPSYLLSKRVPDGLALFFERVSYLCKARTKLYGHGHHGYGSSRA
jgi:Inovirus Gp2